MLDLTFEFVTGMDPPVEIMSMNADSICKTAQRSARLGFTLIELLLVIAIVALLVGILLPGLSGARNEARAIKCSANARGVGQLVQVYTNDFRYLPPAYVYPSSREDHQWRMEEQSGSDSDLGYIHWSFLVTNLGEVAQDAFACPSLWRGGAPRSNWGGKDEDGEGWMINNDATLEDRQVTRVAYAPNDMLIPRNKFVKDGQVLKPYRLARQSDVDATAQGSARTILLSEWLNFDNYRSLESPTQEGRIKSHRPVTPVISNGGVVFKPETTPPSNRLIPFRYPTFEPGSGSTDIRLNDDLGRGMIEDAQTVLNAVGRHHPPKGGAFGGTTNFTFLDGHVERLNITETVQKRLWGDRFFTMTGNNQIEPVKVKVN